MLMRICAGLLLLGSVSMAAEPASTQPITTTNDAAGKLLRQWWAEGTAAGNAGDWYDNRDRGHSNLDTRPYPQLQRFVYSKQELDAHRDWAWQTTLRPFVCFGNSSTSSAVTNGGSNPRIYYSNPGGLDFLYSEYTHNNLYIYPEHRDHDPGHNGVGDGYGDVYPTNTPYLIISQGSSGSDQPFMRALPHVLAAFRPEVKKKLAETGTLMPAIQMIMRRTYKPVATNADYFTYKAHPTVFDGSLINPEAMVSMAHAIPINNLPPMVQLKVVQEEEPVAGRDYFEPRAVSEKLADTPAVVARVFRGVQRSRTMVVSAEKSADLNGRPLEFHWVVLRGDPERTHIRLLNDSGSVVEIKVAYEERRPIAPGSAMESNRVDIALILSNGTYFSAPGFVTFFFLDDEARTYDEQGRILEMGYSMGETSLRVQWKELMEAVKGETALPGMALLRSAMGPQEWEMLAKVAQEYVAADALLADALVKQKEAQAAARKPNLDAAAKKQADAAVSAANVRVEQSKKLVSGILDQKREGLGAARARVEAILDGWVRDLAFCEKQRAILPPVPRDAIARLAALGVARGGEELVLTPLRPGRLSAYERAQVEQLNGRMISMLFKGQVSSVFQVNFVDANISPPKPWRDVYHYDAEGKMTGWTRYEQGKKTDFTAEGLAIERDKAGEIIARHQVVYSQAPVLQRMPNGSPVKWSARP